jgi:hypothetical protein
MNQHIRNLDPPPDDSKFIAQLASMIERCCGKIGVCMKGGWRQFKLNRIRQAKIARLLVADRTIPVVVEDWFTLPPSCRTKDALLQMIRAELNGETQRQ